MFNMKNTISKYRLVNYFKVIDPMQNPKEYEQQVKDQFAVNYFIWVPGIIFVICTHYFK